MIQVLKVMVDGIISDSATKYVEDLKRRLGYELQMAATLRSESHLRLSFDVS